MSERIRSTAALVLVAVLALALGAAPAGAAARVESVNIRLVNDGQGAVMLVGAALPSGQKLPADIQLAVPAGAEILWAGEILGGDPSKDPDAQYTTEKGEGVDIITMTLTQSRTGQVEYRDNAAVSSSGGTQTARISWTSPVDAADGTLSIEVPQGAQVVDAGGATLDSSAGNYYRKTFKDVKRGDKLVLEVVYSGGTSGGTAPNGTPAQPNQQPAQPAQAPAQAPSGQPASPMTVLLVGLALVGATLFVLRKVNSRHE